MVSEIRCWNGICGIYGAEALETALKEAAVDAYLDLAPRARARHTLAYYMSWAAACRTAGRPGTIMFGVAEGKSGRGWRQAFLMAIDCSAARDSGCVGCPALNLKHLRVSPT